MVSSERAGEQGAFSPQTLFTKATFNQEMSREIMAKRLMMSLNIFNV